MPLLFIAAAIAGVIFYVNPQFTEVKRLQAESSEYTSLLSQTVDAQRHWESLIDKYNTMQKEDLDRLAKMLPGDADNITLLMDIDAIADRHNMSISGISLDTSSGSTGAIAGNVSPYGTVKVGFDVTATYPTFIAFIQDLERSLRISDLGGLSFTSSEAGGRYTYSVEIKTYWMK